MSHAPIAEQADRLTELEKLKGSRVRSVVVSEQLWVSNDQNEWQKYPETILYLPGHPVHDESPEFTQAELEAWDCDAFVHGTLADVVADNGTWIRLEDVEVEDNGTRRQVVFELGDATPLQPE